MEENKSNQKITDANLEALTEEDLKMFKDELSEMENLTGEDLQEINMYVKKLSEEKQLTNKELSEMENLTDDELENIAGGGLGNDLNSNLPEYMRRFIYLVGAVIVGIRDNNVKLALIAMDELLHTSRFRNHPITQHLREEFKKKFGFDPLI